MATFLRVHQHSCHLPVPPQFAAAGLPLPPAANGLLDGLKSFGDVDEKACKLFSLDKSESALVEDLCDYTLPDYRGDASSPGYQATARKLNPVGSRARAGMAEYCRFFIDVILAGFGEDKAVCATVYQETNDTRLPVRLVAFHLDWPGQETVHSEALSNEDLCTRLKDVADAVKGRTTRVCSFVKAGGRRIPTVFLVKPDQQRFWTRSMALRDADAVAADIMTWRGAADKAEDSQRPA